MPTNDSYDEIVLRNTHEANLSGYQTKILCGARRLEVPHGCGCVSSFIPTGHVEVGEDGVERAVWRQAGFKFQEYHGY